MSEDKTKKSISSDDNPLGELPDRDRQGMFSMMVVLLGFTFFTSTMFAGGQIGPHYKFFPDLMYVIILGNLLLGIYVAGLGYIAQRTGYNCPVSPQRSWRADHTVQRHSPRSSSSASACGPEWRQKRTSAARDWRA